MRPAHMESVSAGFCAVAWVSGQWGQAYDVVQIYADTTLPRKDSPATCNTRRAKKTENPLRIKSLAASSGLSTGKRHW